MVWVPMVSPCGGHDLKGFLVSFQQVVYMEYKEIRCVKLSGMRTCVKLSGMRTCVKLSGMRTCIKLSGMSIL